MMDVRILGSGEFKILRFKDNNILGFQDLKILGYEDPGSSSYQKFALRLGFLIIQKLIHCHLDLCFGSRPKHRISFSKSNPVFLSARVILYFFQPGAILGSLCTDWLESASDSQSHWPNCQNVRETQLINLSLTNL